MLISLINRREKVGIEILKIPKAFIDYSQIVDNFCENLGDHNPAKKRRVLTVFDDMIAGIKAKKN